MAQKRILRSLHLASTAWFIVCVCYIMVLALRQAGFKWWVIFSLSGHSALVIFLLVSLYLFAFLRGVGKSQKVEIEHPLTSTYYYKTFYVITPFIGGVAGCLGMIGVSTIGQFLPGIVLGTLGTTFLVWVIVDPLTGTLETLLPASRKHRSERHAEAKALREEKQKNRERLLKEVLAQEETHWNNWQKVLKPYAEKLAGLLTNDMTNFQKAESESINIGVKAWQIGGLGCMRQLHNMALTMCKQKHQDESITDYIGAWWNGIGTWRNPSVVGSTKTL